MEFLHASALVMGAAAVMVPILVHFLTRPRPVRMPLSTIKFVRQAVRDQRARHKLRDWLILALRMLAIGLLAACFARPLLNQRPLVDNDSSDDRIHRVVILDCSQSMAAGRLGRDGFQSGRVQAARFLEGGSGLRANLILAGAQPHPVADTLSSNLGMLRDALAETACWPERIDAQAAINRAASQLSQEFIKPGSEPSAAGSDIRRELVIISDFQRTNWAAADFEGLPESTVIQMETVAPDTLRENVAITDVSLSQRATLDASPNLQITIANHTNQPRLVRCEVQVLQSVFQVEGTCAAQSQIQLNHPVTLSAAGWTSGVARLLDHSDELEVDDRFPFVLEVQTQATRMLVTRQSPNRRPSASYFLERALSSNQPTSGNDAHALQDSSDIRRIATDRFDSLSVEGSHLIVLVHPGKLEKPQVDLLAALLRRGRGVLYVASETIDAANLKMLYQTLGNDLQAPVELQLPEVRSPRRDLTVLSATGDRTPFNVFGDQLANILAPIRISGGLPTRRNPGSLDDEILATLSDQSCWLFVSPVVTGNLAILNMDLLESNLPRQPAFVPLMVELVDGLLQESGRETRADCGEPLVRILPISGTLASDLLAVDGNGESIGDFQSSGDSVAWQWNRPTGPQVIEIKHGEKTMAAFSTSLATEESDLRVLDASVLDRGFAGNRRVQFRHVDGQQSQDNVWMWLAVGCVVAMICEVVTLGLWKI